MENETMTLKELSAYLKVSQSGIRNLIKNKSIPIFRIGNRIYAKKSSIDLWITNLEFSNMQDSNYEVKIKPLESEVNKNESNKKGNGFYLASNS